MFRNMIDRIIEFQPSTIVLVLVHGAALVWALRRSDMRPVLVLNVVLAATIIAYNAQAIAAAIGNQDWGMLALNAFALASLICSGAALFGKHVPRLIIWSFFAAGFALSLLLLAFMLLFRIDRLI
jgi:hypothetical protein